MSLVVWMNPIQKQKIDVAGGLANLGGPVKQLPGIHQRHFLFPGYLTHTVGVFFNLTVSEPFVFASQRIRRQQDHLASLLPDFLDEKV